MKKEEKKQEQSDLPTQRMLSTLSKVYRYDGYCMCPPMSLSMKLELEAGMEKESEMSMNRRWGGRSSVSSWVESQQERKGPEKSSLSFYK